MYDLNDINQTSRCRHSENVSDVFRRRAETYTKLLFENLPPPREFAFKLKVVFELFPTKFIEHFNNAVATILAAG